MATPAFQPERFAKLHAELQALAGEVPTPQYLPSCLATTPVKPLPQKKREYPSISPFVSVAVPVFLKAHAIQADRSLHGLPCQRPGLARSRPRTARQSVESCASRPFRIGRQRKRKSVPVPCVTKRPRTRG